MASLSLVLFENLHSQVKLQSFQLTAGPPLILRWLGLLFETDRHERAQSFGAALEKT